MFDHGHLEYDMVGHRMCFIPIGRPDIKKDCICKDPSSGSVSISLYIYVRT